MSCPICIGEGSGEAERLQAEGRVRIPLGDVADAVWFICDQHKVRWREDYRRESWTPDLSNDDERAPHERGWTLGQLYEHRTDLLSHTARSNPMTRRSTTWWRYRSGSRWRAGAVTPTSPRS